MCTPHKDKGIRGWVAVMFAKQNVNYENYYCAFHNERKWG